MNSKFSWFILVACAAYLNGCSQNVEDCGSLSMNKAKCQAAKQNDGMKCEFEDKTSACVAKVEVPEGCAKLSQENCEKSTDCTFNETASEKCSDATTKGCSAIQNSKTCELNLTCAYDNATKTCGDVDEETIKRKAKEKGEKPEGGKGGAPAAGGAAGGPAAGGSAAPAAAPAKPKPATP